MRLKFALLAVLLAIFLASPSYAKTFTVSVSADDSDAHDANPGDGFCRDSFNTCTLRAAIEETNAYAGSDTILFTSTWTNKTVLLSATEGALPAVIDRVEILGSEMATYNSTATLLRDAPPQLFIDGSNLSGSIKYGLSFAAAAASGSIVSGIGIVGFPDSGITIGPQSNNLIIERNYIGVRADGSAAGNGGHGIYVLASDGHLIGKGFDGEAFTGLGNVLSSNARSGAILVSSDNNNVRGNLIGIAPSGSGDRGNGEYGIYISDSTNNYIGGYHSNLESAGNFIAGNDLGGIFSVGNGNRIYTNTLGKGETGGFINSEADGIVVIGSNNYIGHDGRGGNRVYQHIEGSAIRLGSSGGTSADGNFVINNQIGSAGSQFPLLYSENAAGIDVAKGNTNTIRNNIVINSRGSGSPGPFGAGIRIAGDNNLIMGNQVGFVITISGPRAEPNQMGILVNGENNTVGTDISPNHVGGNTFHGINMFSDGNAARFNYVGVTNTLASIGNGSYGLAIADGSNIRVESNVIGNNNNNGLLISGVSDSAFIRDNYIGITPSGDYMGNYNDGVSVLNSSNIDIHRNSIAFNIGNGISTDETVSGVAWYINSMHNNSEIGIDLGNNNRTPNDPGDIDEGPNRLQNFPVIETVVLDSLAKPPTLTIGYRVDTNADKATYPLVVDFYWSDIDENAEGRYFLDTDFDYSTPNALRSVTFNFVDDVPHGWLTATATDQDRNASELADRFEFGEPSDVLFSDGFE